VVISLKIRYAVNDHVLRASLHQGVSHLCINSLREAPSPERTSILELLQILSFNRETIILLLRNGLNERLIPEQTSSNAHDAGTLVRTTGCVRDLAVVRGRCDVELACEAVRRLHICRGTVHASACGGHRMGADPRGRCGPRWDQEQHPRRQEPAHRPKAELVALAVEAVRSHGRRVAMADEDRALLGIKSER
jgi:hypothetical protein